MSHRHRQVVEWTARTSMSCSECLAMHLQTQSNGDITCWPERCTRIRTLMTRKRRKDFKGWLKLTRYFKCIVIYSHASSCIGHGISILATEDLSQDPTVIRCQQMPYIMHTERLLHEMPRISHATFCGRACFATSFCVWES